MNSGDFKTAWAPASSTGQKEFVILEFVEYYRISGIHIFETYNPGAVVRISCLPKGKDTYNRSQNVDVFNFKEASVHGSTQFLNSTSSDWIVLYEGSPQQKSIPEQSRIFTPAVRQGIESCIVKIELDTNDSNSWSELDAVKLIGFPATSTSFASVGSQSIKEKELHVARVLKFSSQYNGWPANNVVGKPNTYPEYGDIKTAWAPSTINKGQEFLELDFNESIRINRIDIYETYNPGALVKVIAYSKNPNQDKNGVVLYSGCIEKGLPEKARIKSITIPQPLETPFRFLRLEMDTSQQRGFYEIDAVKIVGY